MLIYAYIVMMIADKFDNMKINKTLCLILLLAFCFRIIYLIFYHSIPEWNQLTVDNYYHFNWAVNLATGNILGDTTYFRAPFYVYCLGFLYAIFGASLWISRLFGLIIGILSILLTYLIGKKLFDHKTGLLAAAIQAVYPVSLYFESELLLDPLFMLLLQLTLYRLLLWIDNKTYKNASLTGIFMGLAALTRPTILIWAALLLLLILFYRRQITNWYKQILFFVFALLILIAPITIRNLIIAQDPVLISSQGGINFYIGNNPDADGVSAIMPEPMGHNWQISQISHIAENETGKELSSGEISSFWLKKGLEWAIDNPGEFIRLYLKKVYFNISNREISNNRDLDRFFNNLPLLKYNPVSFGILFSLSIAALLLLWRKNILVRLLLALLLAYLFAGSLFFFNSRFRLPLLPIYFILSASGLITILRFFKDSVSKLVIPLVVLLISFLLSIYPIVSLPAGNSPQALMSKGNYYFAQQNYEISLRYNHEAFLVDSLFPEVNLNLGNSYLKSGNIDSAYYFFERETEYHPDRYKAYINLATLKYLDHNYQESLSLIRIALKYNPNDLTANQVLLRATFANDSIDNETCSLTAQESIELTGNDIYLLNEIGILMANRGMLSSAEEILNKALLSHPPPIETDDEAFKPSFRNSFDNMRRQKAYSHFQLGYIKGLQNSYGESIRHSLEAINLDSTLSEAYVNLISGYIAINQSAAADSVLNHALILFPNSSSLLKLKYLIYNQ